MNILMHLLIGLGLFAGSIITRAWIRLRRKDFGIDTWYFLNYADGLRRQKKLPVNLRHYLLDIEEQWYPPLCAFVVSLLPKKIAEKYHWLISALTDSLQAILLYIFSIFLTGRLDIALMAALLYITSPISASIATNLNARPLASLVSTLLMLSVYNFSISQSALSFILVLLVGTILLHTHKMATQQFLFFAAGLAILTGKAVYIYLPILIFLVSLIATKGFYIKILRNNIQIVKFWSRNLPYLWKHQVYTSPLYKNKEKAAARLGVSGMKANKIMFFLARAQLLAALFIIIIFWLKGRNVSDIENFSFFFYWVFINYFTVLATTYLPVFKNIGEGFKYLIYGTFPVCLLVPYAIINLVSVRMTAYSILLILLILNISIQIFTLNRQMLNVNSFVDDELKDVIDRLKRSKEDNILCLPVFKAEPIAYFADKKVLWGGHGSGWDRLNEFYPIIRVPIEDLIKKYKITLVMLDKRFVDLVDLKIGQYIERVFEGKNYLLARVA